MDIERIGVDMLALVQWLDEDNPPLLGLIVLSNGRGLRVHFPRLEEAGARSLEERRTALTLVRLAVGNYMRMLDDELTALDRANLRSFT